MNMLATWKMLILVGSFLIAPCLAAQQPSENLDEVDGPNVRVMRHQDGSRTMFTRTPDNRTLTKRKISANGGVQMLTVYRMDAHQNALSCKIYDGRKNQLFKVSYGYRRSDGQLVEERMFDAQQVRKDANGKETPIQRICYVYDTQGNRSAPIVFNLLPGKTFEQVFGVKSSALETNPFKEDSSSVNPNARPLGR